MIEFESVAAAKAWYDSADYRKIRAIRDSAGEWRMVVVEEMPPGPVSRIVDLIGSRTTG